MKFISLHPRVTRCRPEPPMTGLHNDCGRQDRCARRLAANTEGRPTQDFSKSAMSGWSTVVCMKYVSLTDAPSMREEAAARPMQRGEHV